MTDVHASVLYVEDESLIRELTTTALEDAGFDVVAAPDGNAALDALRRGTASFSAIVTDVNLGDGPDGWDIARRGRELDGALPVVYLTGASGHEWRRLGVSGSVLVMKPFRVAQIISAVRSLLAKVRPACPIPNPGTA